MPIYSESLRNQRLDAISDAIGSACRIMVYSGVPPTSVSEAVAGQALLVEITGGATEFATDASGGTLSPRYFSTNNIALGSGIPTFARFIPSSGSDSDTVMQITAGVGSGELQFSKKITAGAAINISSFTITDSATLPENEGNPAEILVVLAGNTTNLDTGSLANLDHKYKAANGSSTLTKSKIWTGSAFATMLLNHSSGNHHGTSVGLSVAGVGPEAELAFVHEESQDLRDLNIIKHAKNGSGIEAGGEWADGGAQRTALIGHINDAKTALGTTENLRLIWVEDENGSFTSDYAANLLDLIDAIKTDCNEPNIEVVVVESRDIYHKNQKAVTDTSSKYRWMPISSYSRSGTGTGTDNQNNYSDVLGLWSIGRAFQVGADAYSYFFGGPVTIYGSVERLGKSSDGRFDDNEFELEAKFILPDGFAEYTETDKLMGIASSQDENGGSWALFIGDTGKLTFLFAEEHGEGSNTTYLDLTEYDMQATQYPWTHKIEFQLSPWPYFTKDTEYTVLVKRAANIVTLHLDGSQVASLDTTTTIDFGGTGASEGYSPYQLYVGSWVAQSGDDYGGEGWNALHGEVTSLRIRRSNTAGGTLLSWKNYVV